MHKPSKFLLSNTINKFFIMLLHQFYISQKVAQLRHQPFIINIQTLNINRPTSSQNTTHQRNKVVSLSEKISPRIPTFSCRKGLQLNSTNYTRSLSHEALRREEKKKMSSHPDKKVVGFWKRRPYFRWRNRFLKAYEDNARVRHGHYK